MSPDAADLDAHRLAIIVRDRCHYVISDGERVLIPGCMGAAVYGESGCTCEDAPGGNAELRALVERMDERLRVLNSRDINRQRQIHELKDRLARLETFMRPTDA